MACSSAGSVRVRVKQRPTAQLAAPRCAGDVHCGLQQESEAAADVQAHLSFAVRVQARPARPGLRPQAARADRRRLRRDDRDHAVPVPGLELPDARQVQGPDHGHRHRGNRSRGDDRHHGGPAAGRRPGHRHHQGRRRRPGGRRCAWRDGTPSRPSSPAVPARRLQRLSVERPLHRGQRQPAGRLPGQRRGRGAGAAADRPGCIT